MTNEAVTKEMAGDAAPRVTQAGYYEEGYAVARWDGADDKTVTAFVLTLRGIRTGSVDQRYFIVEDGWARSAAFPCELEAGTQYTMTVTPYRGETALTSSGPYSLPLPLRPLSGFAPLDFTERLAYTPLLIGPGQNVVKVRLLAADGKPIQGEAISWSVPAEYTTVRLHWTGATKTDRNGVAANLIFVGRGDDAPQSLTVSAWRGAPTSTGAASEAHRICAVFDCVEANVFCSFARNYARPLPTDSHYTRHSPNRPPEDELIVATATVLDDESRPIRGLWFSWRMEPNAATLAYRREPNQALSWLDWTGTPLYESGFRVVTNEHGQSTIAFANSEPQIMGVSPAVNSVESPYSVVFTAVDLGSGSLPALRLPTSRNYLDLDAYPDAVPVAIPIQVEEIDEVAIWLNNDIVSIDYLASTSKPNDPIWIPSWRFVSGDAINAIGYVGGYLGGNAGDSRLSKVRVVGTPRVPGPEPGGRYEAPLFEEAGIGIVNDSTIAGGLQIRIPAYVDIAAGQRVTLNVYLKGYYQNSPYERFGFVKYRHEVTEEEVPVGFVMVVDQNELTGYGLSPGNRPGTLVAQYAVTSTDSARSVYSKQLTAPIATTVPYKSSTWVALSPDDAPDDDASQSLPGI